MVHNNDNEARIAAVRAFNRRYTQRIGALGDGYLDSPFSLAEARVLYELAQRRQPTAAVLARDLGLDAGYLSRILRRFERTGLVARQRSAVDGRERLLSLTDAGRAAFAPLDEASRQQIATMLGALSGAEQERFVAALDVATRLLDGQATPPEPYILRPPLPGDLGWIVQRHGALYAAEYGWDERFEALVAEIVAHFIRHFDARRERCWIAERAGENVGCVMLVRHPEREGVAKLRLLLVEPAARGLGIGRRLVEECTRFARQAGYHTITLWTNSVLVSAIRIYEAAGYHLVHEAAEPNFGHDLVSQTWELALTEVGGRKSEGRCELREVV